jgi:nucleoside-diphosphate-sugar epimerase
MRYPPLQHCSPNNYFRAPLQAISMLFVSPMATELVFITGGTGHIGFRTLVVALQHGYSVRAAVRSESKKQQILLAPSIKSLNPGPRLTFVVVPDLTVDGAYDEAVKGAAYIIHLASPIVLKGEIKPEDFHTTLINPAIRGTLSVLEAAAKTKGIKRVVITSSVVGFIPSKYMFDIETPEGKFFDHNSKTTLDHGPYPSDFHAYNASKVSALQATDAFVRDYKPGFDVTNIHPSFVIGKNELITDAKDITIGTNGAAMALVLGYKSEIPVVGASVHVDDVAFMHVKALDSKIPAGTYVGNSDGYAGTVWQNATRIVAERFPKAVAKGIFPNDGLQPTRRLRVDATKTEKVMDFKFLSYEEQVNSVVSHYLELRGEDSA